MSEQGVPYPLSVPDPRGRPMTWKLYGVTFDSPDGQYGFHIYAISDDHAALQLQAIKETARIDGRIEQVILDGDTK